MRWLLLGGLVLGVVGLAVWRLNPVSGQATVTRVVSPSSWPLDGGNFQVQMEIEDVVNLGAYEWELKFDPAIIRFVDVVDGGFLGSSGRSTSFCGRSSYIDPAKGRVRFGCATAGWAPDGPSGSGVLSIVTFSPLAQGTTDLDLRWVQLSDPDAEDMASQRQGSCLAIGGAPPCATPTVAPPATPTPFPSCVDRLGDTSCENPIYDPDDDGCTADQEAALGSVFDGTFYGWYDVYDVPVPVKADANGANGTRDKVVNMSDPVAVLFYVGTSEGGSPNSNGVAYDAVKGVDLNGDSVDDVGTSHGIKEGLKYDRSPGVRDPVTGIRTAGPPNGFINMQDVIVVQAQVGKIDCRGGQ